MKKNNNKLLFFIALFLVFNNFQNIKSYECGFCDDEYDCDFISVKSCKSASVLGYVFDEHWDCDSFLIKYSPYRNFVAVLMIDKGNNGYKVEIFNTYTKEKIFDFEPMTMPMADFILGEDRIIVQFSDSYGTQIAYDIYTGEILWRS